VSLLFEVDQRSTLDRPLLVVSPRGMGCTPSTRPSQECAPDQNRKTSRLPEASNIEHVFPLAWLDEQPLDYQRQTIRKATGTFFF
jgi:hypothetical protein